VHIGHITGRKPAPEIDGRRRSKGHHNHLCGTGLFPASVVAAQVAPVAHPSAAPRMQAKSGIFQLRAAAVGDAVEHSAQIIDDLVTVARMKSRELAVPHATPSRPVPSVSSCYRSYLSPLNDGCPSFPSADFARYSTSVSSESFTQAASSVFDTRSEGFYTSL
jgi:hypothetical protein